jgi:hypothetical protein
MIFTGDKHNVPNISVKQFKMALMIYSGARGKLTHEKT